MSCAVMMNTVDEHNKPSSKVSAVELNDYPISPQIHQSDGTFNSNIGGNKKSSSTTTTTTTPNYEQQCRSLEDENLILRSEKSRLEQQCADSQRRERILTKRLAIKEQEYQEFVNQIAAYKSSQAPGPAALKAALLDPAVNLLIEKLRKELQATKSKLEETQNELSAWKFTPDSNTGKRLMAKCRLLYQENEELGKMTSNGRLAKLEGELAMHKSFSEEVKKSQSELDGVIQELDEDVEAMQSTILLLQQELKTTKERIEHLENENKNLKDDNKKPLNGIVPCATSTSPKPEPLHTIKEEVCDNDKIINGTVTEALENGSSGNNGKLQRQRKRNYDSDASDIAGDAATEVVTTKRAKRKTRRSSILDSVDETMKTDVELPTEQSDTPAPTEGSKKILTRRKSSRNLLNGNV
ncbi:WTAP family protein [Megaselia abdita]